MSSKITFRDKAVSNDIKTIYDMVKSTGFFRDDEELIAKELIEEKVRDGEKCSYRFLFLEVDGKPVSYTCFGLIPCSLISYDLYWIVTHNDYRGKGYGQILLAETEKYIKKLGGAQVVVETSSKEIYKSTQHFYEKCNYKLAVLLDDFYDYGDGKLVYIKKV